MQDVQGAEEVRRQKAAAKEAALLEQRVLAMSTALGTVVEDTRGNVEKKQARTYEEMKAEQEEQEQVLQNSLDMCWANMGNRHFGRQQMTCDLSSAQ